MITYFYWLFILTLTLTPLYFIGVRLNHWKGAGITAGSIFLIGILAYYFHFQQVFVKNWGGFMTITVPEGQYHIAATWKDDNLWVENYDPKTNRCEFKEYSKGAVLQGVVHIKNCNPIGAK